MKDDVIIKSFEKCFIEQYCEGCPLVNLNNCTKVLGQGILDLIDRQKAEIDILIRKKEALRDEIAEQQTEIERLKKCRTH